MKDPAEPELPASPPPDPAAAWNQRFSGEEYVFGTAPNEWLRAHAGVWPPGGRILSVADGEGRNSVWLAQQGFRVEAFDVAPAGIAKARRLAETRGAVVQFRLADSDSFDWAPATYDGIAAIFVQFADPPTRTRLFANIVRSLKPGGTLVLQGYSLKQLEYRTGGPSQPGHLYSAELIRRGFPALEIQVLKEYEADVDEGPGHRGRSALLGLVARRPGTVD